MALAGKVVLITGASKGIGKAATLHLASQGANVVINYNRDSESANAMVHQIGPDRALAVQADASNLSDLDRLVEATVSKFGKIDVVIPNAGILPMKDLESTTEEDFDNTFNLLVKGPYFLVQVSYWRDGPEIDCSINFVFCLPLPTLLPSYSPALYALECQLLL